MTASVVELNRSTQQSKSLAAVPQPKPARSFDDILAGQRTKAAEPERKPEPRVDHAKSSKKTEARSKTKAADDSQPVDDTQDVSDDEATDAAETESAESSQAKSTKKTESKVKPKGDADAVDDTGDAEATTEQTDATCPTDALPAVESEADGEAVEDAVTKPATAAKKEDEAVVSPEALLAAGQQAVPTTPTEATATSTAATDESAEATTTVAAAGQVAAKHADTKALTDAATEVEAVPEARPKLKPITDKAIDLEADAATAASQVFVPTDADLQKSTEKTDSSGSIDASALQAVASHEKTSTAHSAMPAVQANEAAAPQRTVAEENVDRIVTSVRGEMQKGGGTMQIRLDPPSLGAIQLQISIDDGVVSASMQTSNDEATRLLSHNLQQLKSTLESAGVMVDKIQVKQAAPAEQSSSNSQTGQGEDGRQSGQAFDEQSARQEQQRREALQRMWAKLAGTGDPLDLVA